VPSATFVAPFGPIVPMVAIAMSVGVAAGATREQLIGGLAALAVGAVLYVIRGPKRAALRSDVVEKTAPQ